MNKLTNHRAFSYATIALTLAAIGTLTIAESKPVFAQQLAPDKTLGTENSIFTPQLLRDLIQGGAIRGNALFHSFDEFNVGDGGSVFFDLQNNTDILNIFTRVTGSNSSNILGTLGVLQDALNSDVLGNANLFLLNPNGITFGANASLQLNGSFFATTADGFGLDDFAFSASGEEAPPPLLTVSIPRFASFRDSPGDIAVNQSNLSVNQGQSLSLVGGNITVEGGQINAPGGRIELAGMYGEGSVTLNDDLSLVLSDLVAPDSGSFELAETNVTDTGTVTINADTLTLSNGVQIVSQTGNGTELGGITINATDSVNVRNFSQIRTEVDGTGSAEGITINANNVLVDERLTNSIQSLIEVQATENSSAIANAGDLNINTNTLNVSNRGRIQTLSSGAGSVGEINIHADEAINFSNFGQLFAEVQGAGNVGNVTIYSPDIALEGQSGLFINVGNNPGNMGIGNSTDQDNARATGSVGKLEINTRTLRLFNFDETDPNLRSRINAQTWGAGDVGDNVDIDGNSSFVSIIINASESVTFDRGQIFAQTRASGEVGDIIINTPSLSFNENSIIFSRTGRAFLAKKPELDDAIEDDNDFATGNAGNIVLNVGTLNLSHSNPVFRNRDGSKIQSQTFGVGEAGDIIINASESVSISSDFEALAPSNQSTITSSFGSISLPENRTAGDITVNTSSLSLSNGNIIADTTGNGNAGTIRINASDLVMLRNGSEINVNARNSSTGGNIFISTEILVASPYDNDISANAERNAAGNVTITDTEVIFGIQERDEDTSLSDITATSEVGADGEISINTNVETDPSEGLVKLPEEVIDSYNIVTQSVCSDFGGESQLANTGRGGVPQIPGFIIRNDVVDVELVDEVLPAPPPEAIKPHHRTDVTFLDSNGEEFKPAMGAVLLPNGMVEFVDYNPAEVYRDMYAAAGCSN